MPTLRLPSSPHTWSKSLLHISSFLSSYPFSPSISSHTKHSQTEKSPLDETDGTLKMRRPEWANCMHAGRQGYLLSDEHKVGESPDVRFFFPSNVDISGYLPAKWALGGQDFATYSICFFMPRSSSPFPSHFPFPLRLPVLPPETSDGYSFLRSSLSSRLRILRRRRRGATKTKTQCLDQFGWGSPKSRAREKSKRLLE